MSVYHLRTYDLKVLIIYICNYITECLKKIKLTVYVTF